MNWIHFLLWLAGIYFLYYLAVVLWDMLKNQNTGKLNSTVNELTFTEQVVPADAAALMEKVPSDSVFTQTNSTPEIIASGGVPLKDIFSLARKEAINYIKAVSF